MFQRWKQQGKLKRIFFHSNELKYQSIFSSTTNHSLIISWKGTVAQAYGELRGEQCQDKEGAGYRQDAGIG